MFLNSDFGRTVDLLERSMDVSLLRRRVIADNIANSDTPEFKRNVVNFETKLKQALESEKRAAADRASGSNFRIVEKAIDYKSVEPKKVLDYLTTSKNNGNNVDVEEEFMSSLQNQMRYDLLTTAVTNQFSRVNIVLK